MEPTSAEQPVSGWTHPGGAPPTPPTGGPPARRPWWRRRWGIAAIVVGVILVLGVVGSLANPQPPRASESPSPSTPLAAASPSPSSVASPSPSLEASASPSTEPSIAPTPVPTLEPTPVPTPAPVAVILKASGHGDRVVKLAAQDAPTIARITGKGSGNFAVVSYAGSEYNDLLVNEIGSYAGAVYVAAGVTRFKVTSSGSWTIEVRPIETARPWAGASPLAGKGDSVVGVSGSSSGIVTIANKGHDNFAIVAYTPEGDYLDLLVNEIGSYHGQVILPDADPMILVISDVGGSWSFSSVSQ